jgi:hypothetical protein
MDPDPEPSSYGSGSGSGISFGSLRIESLSLTGLSTGRTVLRLQERRSGLEAWALATLGAGLEAADTPTSLTVGDIITFRPALTPLDPTAGENSFVVMCAELTVYIYQCCGTGAAGSRALFCWGQRRNEIYNIGTYMNFSLHFTDYGTGTDLQ